MSFVQAFSYPFHDLAKILKIVLVFLAIFMSLTVGSVIFGTPLLAMLRFPITIGYTLFSSGYMVSVIREVADRNEQLPDVRFGLHVGQGFTIFVAGFVYALPIIVLLVAAFFYFSPTIEVAPGFDLGGIGYRYAESASNPSPVLLLLLLLSLVLSLFLGFAALVGMIRYATTNDFNALLQFSKNFSLVFANLGAVFGLFLRMIMIAALYGVALWLIDSAFQGMIYNFGSEWLLYTVFALYSVVSYTLSFMNQLSQSHLMANFGNQTGIIPFSEKRKAKHATA